MDDVASFSAKAFSRPGFARALKTLMMGIEGRSSYDLFSGTSGPPRQFSGFRKIWTRGGATYWPKLRRLTTRGAQPLQRGDPISTLEVVRQRTLIVESG